MTGIRIERDGHVAVITIDRPQAANAIDQASWRAIGDGLAALDTDPGVRAVVLTGSGDKVFCAGADLKELARGELIPSEDRFAEWGFAGYVAHTVGVPTIAAVNGLALGGGTELTLASDLAVAVETAEFALPEVTRGIVASGGGAFRLPEQVPPKLAMELLLTGRRIDAARALELGLINAVVPVGQARVAAVALANEIAAAAPLAVRATKRLAQDIVDGHRRRERDLWVRAREERRAILATADAAEGMAAFAERRRPEWAAR